MRNQLGSKSDGLGELGRLTRYSEGWKYPHTFSMESGKGYWRRYVIPKIDLGTGWAEYRGALRKVLAPFGALHPPPKNGADAVAAPKVKGNAKMIRLGMGAGLAQNTLKAGPQDATRLYPSGKRQLKPGRNLSMAHAPRAGKEVFCWDWNSRGGCPRGEKCERKHDSMGDKNLHCATAANRCGEEGIQLDRRACYR